MPQAAYPSPLYVGRPWSLGEALTGPSPRRQWELEKAWDAYYRRQENDAIRDENRRYTDWNRARMEEERQYRQGKAAHDATERERYNEYVGRERERMRKLQEWRARNPNQPPPVPPRGPGYKEPAGLKEIDEPSEERNLYKELIGRGIGALKPEERAGLGYKKGEGVPEIPGWDQDAVVGRVREYVRAGYTVADASREVMREVLGNAPSTAHAEAKRADEARPFYKRWLGIGEAERPDHPEFRPGEGAVNREAPLPPSVKEGQQKQGKAREDAEAAEARRQEAIEARQNYQRPLPPEDLTAPAAPYVMRPYPGTVNRPPGQPMPHRGVAAPLTVDLDPNEWEVEDDGSSGAPTYTYPAPPPSPGYGSEFNPDEWELE